MSFFMQRVLEFSMLLESKNSRMLRLLGKIAGVVPVWYAKRRMRRLRKSIHERKSGRHTPLHGKKSHGRKK